MLRSASAPVLGGVAALLTLLAAAPAVAAPNRNYDVERMALEVDVTTRAATAWLTIRNDATVPYIHIDTGDLMISSVTDPQGAPLTFVTNGQYTKVRALPGTSEVVFSYEFQQPPTTFHQQGASADGDERSSYTWPDNCGDIFPCDPHPSEGFSYSLNLLGVPTGQTAIYAPESYGEAPAYMLAWTVADYQTQSLGFTNSGTEILVAYLASSAGAAQTGTAQLVEMFEFFEDTYGPYSFGPRAGVVQTVGQYSGIEHHPFWHLDPFSMRKPEVQAHEAAHGWFGNGVRLACWEDMVLSEGFAEYLAGRAIEHAYGAAAGADYWADQITDVTHPVLPILSPQIVWGTGCTSEDANAHIGTPTYVKGAMFLYSLEAAIGRAALDAAIASFYQANVGQAATFEMFLQNVQTQTTFDPHPCAEDWLRSTVVPASYDCAPTPTP